MVVGHGLGLLEFLLRHQRLDPSEVLARVRVVVNMGLSGPEAGIVQGDPFRFRSAKDHGGG
jgi:hypothetical protein